MIQDKEGRIILDTQAEVALFRIFLKHYLRNKTIDYDLTESTESLMKKASATEMKMFKSVGQ